jgi:hypothetical protein
MRECAAAVIVNVIEKVGVPGLPGGKRIGRMRDTWVRY